MGYVKNAMNTTKAKYILSKAKIMNFKFATAINCIDGRVKAAVAEFIKNSYNVDYVDMITVPGPDKLLSEYKNIHEIESIKRKMLVSCSKHDSKLLFIVGHDDCAVNPAEEKKHYAQIKKSMENIKKWNLKIDVHGIWINKNLEAVAL